MDSLIFSFEAVFPILLTILCGALFARYTSWDKSFYKKLNSIIFRILFPVNLFYSVYSINDLSELNLRMLLFLMLSTMPCLLIGWIASNALGLPGKQKSVIMHASFRTNMSVIGLPLVAAICTVKAKEAAAFASMAICGGAIINNIVAVSLLTYYGGKKQKTTDTLKSILKNPLVIGSVSGIMCVLYRQFVIPDSGFRLETALPSIFKVVKSLSAASSPVALLCLGGLMDFKAGRDQLREISIGVVLRLIICPTIVMGAAIILKKTLCMTVAETPGLIAYTASPAAIASAIMAQEMGGDSQLASHIVVWSSAFSIITLFVFIYFFRNFGLL